MKRCRQSIRAFPLVTAFVNCGIGIGEHHLLGGATDIVDDAGPIGHPLVDIGDGVVEGGSTAEQARGARLGAKAPGGNIGGEAALRAWRGW